MIIQHFLEFRIPLNLHEWFLIHSSFDDGHIVPYKNKFNISNQNKIALNWYWKQRNIFNRIFKTWRSLELIGGEKKNSWGNWIGRKERLKSCDSLRWNLFKISSKKVLSYPPPGDTLVSSVSGTILKLHNYQIRDTLGENMSFQ